MSMLERVKPESEWKRSRGEASLSDVHRTIPVKSGGTSWRRAAAFVGPGYLVAVGYMDPGNWATSLAGGSKFGYTLLVVALVSNIMAIVLQALCARLAIASGRDLAQACRDAFPKPVALFLWFLAEIAIIATDIAEVIGTAIGLNLIFGIPLEIGVIITALDVFLILYLQRLGFRWVDHHASGRHRGLFRDPDRAGQPRLGRRDQGLCPDNRDRNQPGNALSRARHSRRDRDAA
jgi:manganese transport protein